jgi:hypothetical protein
VSIKLRNTVCYIWSLVGVYSANGQIFRCVVLCKCSDVKEGVSLSPLAIKKKWSEAIFKYQFKQRYAATQRGPQREERHRVASEKMLKLEKTLARTTVRY